MQAFADILELLERLNNYPIDGQHFRFAIRAQDKAAIVVAIAKLKEIETHKHLTSMGTAACPLCSNQNWGDIR